MTAGQSFVKSIRPIGCVLFIVVLLLFLILAFTSGGGKVLDTGDYAPPASLDETDPLALSAELKDNLLPRLPGENTSYVTEGKLFVELSGDHFSDCRATVLHFYPDSGIQFKRK